MATKINPDFYGAESSFVTLTPNTKYSPYTLQDLVTRGVYDGGSLDTTASPWGIGQSSISSQFAFFPTKGANWTMFDIHNDKKNTPLFFFRSGEPTRGFSGPWNLVGADATDANFTKAIYKSRTYPHAVINNNQVTSSMNLDNGARVDLDNTTYIQYITYLNYQKIRIYPWIIYYIPTGSDSIQSTTLDNIVNHSVSVDYIIGILFTTIDRDGSSVSMSYSVGSYELPIPNEFKPCYYTGDDKWVRPWRVCGVIGHWDWSTDFGMQFRPFSSSDVHYTSQFETPNSGNPVRGYQVVTGYGSMSRHNQVFDDVSYHWEYGMTPYGTTIHTVSPIETGDLYQEGTFWCYSRMVLDGEYDDKNLAFVNAVMHELSFMGLPCARTASEAQNNIGSNYIYLPVFDEHMITTGDFKKGSDSTELPNAQWNNIFGSEMPEYDPDYEPDTPPEPDSDFGDLSNEGHMQYRFDTRLNIWCFYNGGQYAGIDTVLNAINNLYLTDPDGNSKWQLDFKGSNPSDYIVGLYATPLIVPHSTGLSTFTLGPVDFDGDIQTYTYTGSGHFTFGSVNLYGDDYPLFNDFRDYAPYTQIELYIPLCGTVTIDPAFFVGHSITVDMYYDILTMSCVAAIYRDGITLYKTVNGSIGAEIPITSLDMGSYQNTIHSLESAQKQNDMRLMTSVLTMGASAAAAIATGGVSLGVGAAALAGGAGLLQTAEQGQQIDYNIDHTAPTVAQTGTAEAQNSFCVGSMYAKLFVKRAKLLSGHNDTVYSKTVGNACCINDYIGGTEDNPRAGLVVCSNINTNDIVNDYGESPTAEEINAIKQAFSTGVYI